MLVTDLHRSKFKGQLKIYMPVVCLVGCEYGDKADWCLGRQGFQCYIDADICCATCQNFITSIPGEGICRQG